MLNMEHPDGENSFAYNGIPSSHIISESKTVVDGLKTFLHEINDTDFEDEWKKRNQESVNPVEAVIEFIGRFTDDHEWIEDTQNNSEYLKMLIKRDSTFLNSIMDHGIVTVLFNNVSMLFVKHILECRLNTSVVNSKTVPVMKVGFWVPPTVNDNVELQEAYAQVFANLNDIKNQWLHFFNIAEKTDKEITKIVQDVSRIYPWGTQVISCVTCGMSSWRQLFKLCTDFNVDSEIRFTLLHLSYKFKKRYPHCFQDMIVKNEKEEVFGVDTIISSEDVWKELRIEFKDL